MNDLKCPAANHARQQRQHQGRANVLSFTQDGYERKSNEWTIELPTPSSYRSEAKILFDFLLKLKTKKRVLVYPRFP